MQPCVEFWKVPSLNYFYNAKVDITYVIPAFAARLENDQIILDEEHTEYKWIQLNEIEDYIQ